MYKNLQGLGTTPRPSKLSTIFAFRTRFVFASVLTIGALVSIMGTSACEYNNEPPFKSNNTMVIPSSVPKLQRTCVRISTERDVELLRMNHTVAYESKVWFVDGHVAGVGEAEDDPAVLCWQN
jgi:hypothetical protein